MQSKVKMLELHYMSKAQECFIEVGVLGLSSLLMKAPCST